MRYIWVRLWANGNKPPQITTIDDSNKSENKFWNSTLRALFRLWLACLKPSWLLARSALMWSAAGANDQNCDSLTLRVRLGQPLTSTPNEPDGTTETFLPAKQPGQFSIRTFCVPACQPVAKMTVEVKRIPMMNDFMSMEFIQGQTYES